MREVRNAAGVIIGTAALVAMIAASAVPRCPAADPDRCYAVARQGLPEIAKDAR